MYAGVRMIPAIWKALDHAVIQLIGAAIIAWVLSERWQRWRQRRDFHHATLVKFSSLSAQVLMDLTHLLVARGKIVESERRRLGIEALSRRAQLLAMDAEMFGLFEDGGQAAHGSAGAKEHCSRTSSDGVCYRTCATGDVRAGPASIHSAAPADDHPNVRAHEVHH
jgi:hypothetical protein